jgi:hypothetical protein
LAAAIVGEIGQTCRREPPESCPLRFPAVQTAGGSAATDASYSAEAEVFRAQVRQFLADNLPAGWTGVIGLPEESRHAFVTEWRKKLSGSG